MRKVHASIFLGLARESSQARSVGRVRREDPVAKPVPDKVLQDRVEVLQKENGD